MAPPSTTEVEQDGSSEETPPGLPKEIKDAAAGAKQTPEEQDKALAWLMADESDAAVQRRVLNINVNTRRNPDWIDWTIQSIDREVLRQIQRATTGGNRGQRRAGTAEMDQGEANLRVAAAGTVEPDLDMVADKKGIQRGPDPYFHRMAVLRWRFRDKPGLVDQIAAEVMDLSGYDDEDVQESVEAAAAGN